MSTLTRVFEAILETRSVTAAASALSLTQSAVSNQLARLRDAFDDPLFVRTTEGMVPTPRAMAIAEPVRKALLEIRQCLEQQLGFDPATSERTFKIFMSDVGQMIFAPRLLERITRSAPRVSIHTVQVPPAQMRDMALESGDLRRHGAREPPDHREALSLDPFLATPHLVYQP